MKMFTKTCLILSAVIGVDWSRIVFSRNDNWSGLVCSKG